MLKPSLKTRTRWSARSRRVNTPNHPELPLRHPLQRQHTLLLGPRAGQPAPSSPASRPRIPSRLPPFLPNPQRLITEPVGKDYIALTQMLKLHTEAGWNNTAEREAFVPEEPATLPSRLSERAVERSGCCVAESGNSFPVRMASAPPARPLRGSRHQALPTHRQRRRVLFLVDRLELEDQANKAFITQLEQLHLGDLQGRRDGWRKAEIVVTTRCGRCYSTTSIVGFSPTDFDLVISDGSRHRWQCPRRV